MWQSAWKWSQRSTTNLAWRLAKKSVESYFETSNFMNSRMSIAIVRATHLRMHPRITHPYEPNEPTSPRERWSFSAYSTIQRKTNITQNGIKGVNKKISKLNTGNKYIFFRLNLRGRASMSHNTAIWQAHYPIIWSKQRDKDYCTLQLLYQRHEASLNKFSDPAVFEQFQPPISHSSADGVVTWCNKWSPSCSPEHLWICSILGLCFKCICWSCFCSGYGRFYRFPAWIRHEELRSEARSKMQANSQPRPGTLQVRTEWWGTRWSLPSRQGSRRTIIETGIRRKIAGRGVCHLRSTETYVSPAMILRALFAAKLWGMKCVVVCERKLFIRNSGCNEWLNWNSHSLIM